ncbi:MAG TPA: hypothetical protein VM099_02040 [Gemmatimonadaceae bacterium]|nr:hypothetical protein [Gemmatimonadaceae bacterium]
MSDDSRRAQIQHFRERWSEFHRDSNDESLLDFDQTAPPGPRPTDPRGAYVYQLKKNWSNFLDQEAEGDAEFGRIVWATVGRGVLYVLLAIIIYISDLSDWAQWMIGGILTVVYGAASLVAWQRWKNARHTSDSDE